MNSPNELQFEDLAPIDQFSYCTVRIEGTTNSGQKITGTGFHYNITSTPGLTAPIVITNKHVLQDLKRVRFLLTAKGDDGYPIHSSHIPIELEDFEVVVKFHPDPSVDLCALSLQFMLNHAEEKGMKLYYRSFDSSMLPDEEKSAELGSYENIMMIGYPNGIWDHVNNLPIIRKGTTATHPCIDFQGRREFVIDAACYPGSSGSPIFINDPGGYRTKRGIWISTYRLILLGILYAGPQYNANGEIEIVDIPTVQKPIAKVSIPNNLGYAIHASRIRELEEVFKLDEEKEKLIQRGLLK